MKNDRYLLHPLSVDVLEFALSKTEHCYRGHPWMVAGDQIRIRRRGPALESFQLSILFRALSLRPACLVMLKLD
jgi:hypothetical protein